MHILYIVFRTDESSLNLHICLPFSLFTVLKSQADLI